MATPARINLKGPASSVDSSTVENLGPRPAELSSARPMRGTNLNRLGHILVELGRLDMRTVEAVLAQQAQQPKRFGELAVALGYVARTDIDLALAHQFDVDFLPAEGGDDARTGPHVQLATHQDILRGVRSQLVLRWFGEAPEQRTLAIVSPESGDGRTHVCASLGRLMAELDEDTLVIDANLNRPSLHSAFGVDNRTGLSSYLNQQATRVPIRAVRGLPRLHVLPAGPLVKDGPSLLERRQFGLMLATLARRYAFVLIDTPPATESSEALTVAVRASGSLIVARRDRTRMRDAQQLSDRLRELGVEVLGAVINER